MGHYNSIILGRKGYGWGEYPHYYLNYDIGKYGFPEGTDGRIATQVNIWLKEWPTWSKPYTHKTDPLSYIKFSISTEKYMWKCFTLMFASL